MPRSWLLAGRPGMSVMLRLYEESRGGAYPHAGKVAIL